MGQQFFVADQSQVLHGFPLHIQKRKTIKFWPLLFLMIGTLSIQSGKPIMNVLLCNFGILDAYLLIRFADIPHYHIVQAKILLISFLKQENDFEPYLLYGLALNSGPVWSLEWCPSGCIDTSNTVTPKRLGLLAVATSDSFVYIYSVDTVGDDT